MQWELMILDGTGGDALELILLALLVELHGSFLKIHENGTQIP